MATGLYYPLGWKITIDRRDDGANLGGMDRQINFFFFPCEVK